MPRRVALSRGISHPKPPPDAPLIFLDSCTSRPATRIAAGLVIAVLALVSLAAVLPVWAQSGRAAARVVEVRWGDHNSYTRGVVELSALPSSMLVENRSLGSERLVFLILDGVETPSNRSVVPVGRNGIVSYQWVPPRGDGRPRLAIKVDRPARTTVLSVTGPPRVVVDLAWFAEARGSGGATPANAAMVSSPSALVASANATAPAPVAKPRPAATAKSGSSSVFSFLSPVGDVIRSISGGGDEEDEEKVAAPAEPRATRPTSASPPPRSVSYDDSLALDAQDGSTGRRRIIIDPGHGGWHKGAMGKVDGRTVWEKDIVMQVARRLKARLDATGRYDTRLTRTTDEYISLGARADFAMDNQGDLFVSLHCNAVDGAAAQRRARGFEIWYWNKNGSTSAAAKLLERLENDEGDHSGLDSARPEARRMLSTLMADQLESQAAQSRILCETMGQAFTKDEYFRKHWRGIHSARFKVLENYMMPSMLVELGFLSHPEEAKLLADDAFQDRCARYLADGIENIMRRMQPAGSSTMAQAGR